VNRVQRGDAFIYNGGAGFGCVLHVNDAAGVALVQVDSGRIRPFDISLRVTAACIELLTTNPLVVTTEGLPLIP
jgi:hypothetical protein